jgi:hypothetical protein
MCHKSRTTTLFKRAAVEVQAYRCMERATNSHFPGRTTYAEQGMAFAPCDDKAHYLSLACSATNDLLGKSGETCNYG